MNAIHNIARQMSHLLVVVGVGAFAAATSSPAHAQTNLALGKPAQQSSLSPWSTGSNDAQGAVDGVKNGRFGFHTNSEPNPWWKVDLQQVTNLGEIRVYNRMDVPARASSLLIYLSSDGANWQLVHNQNGAPFGGTTDGKPLQVNVNGRQARYVKLQLAGTDYLHLDEVEVYGPSSTTTGQQATGSFHAVWSTDLGLYLGLVQSGNQVRGYYWWDGAWYPLLTGTVTGRTLSGRWDATVADGTFQFTLAPDGRGFDAEATGLYGMVQLTFKGGLYSLWQ